MRRFDRHTSWISLLFRRAAPDLPGLDVELRAVPRALDDAADQDAVRERAAPVRAAILERRMTALGSRDDDALVVHVYQLHLVHAERRRRRRERARAAVLTRLLLPFARVRVAMIDTNLVAEGERETGARARSRRRPRRSA